MAENRVSIIINARNMASDALNRVKSEFNGLGEASRTYQRTLSEVNGTMSSAMSTAMRFAGIIAGGLTFGAAIQSAYNYTKTMEDTKLGLASLAYATMDFKDAQGQLMTGQAAFNESLRFSAQLQDKLRIAGLTTAATYEQLAQSINVAWVPAMKAGFNPDQIIQFTQAITQQATAMGMDLNRMSEEIRSVLTGNMRDGDTQLKSFMEAAGLTNAKIKELLGTGQLFPAMMHAFEGSTMAAAVANTNLSTIMSNLKDGIQGILGTTFAQFFDAVKVSAADLTSHLVTVKDGTIQWNQSLVEIGRTIGSAMGAVVTWTYEHVIAVAKWIAKNEDMIQIAGLVAIAIGSLWASLLLLQGIAGIISTIIMFETTLKSLAGAVGLCEAVFAPWVIAIAAVAAAFGLWNLYPLIKDVELFGHTIDTWLNLLKFKTQEIMASAVEMFTNAFWNTPQELLGRFLVLLADCLDSVVSFFSSGDMLSAILGWFKQAFVDPMVLYGGEFLNLLSDWFDSFKTFWSQGFSGIVSSAVSWFSDLFINKLPDFFISFTTKLGEWFGKIVDFFKNFSLETAINDIRNWGKSWQDSANQGKSAAEDHKNITLAAIQASKDAALQAEARAKTEKTAAEQEKQARVEAEAKKTLAVQDNAKEIDKTRKDQKSLNEALLKAETALVEDETKKQLVAVKNQYDEWVTQAHGNSALLERAKRDYFANVEKIRREAGNKEKAQQEQLQRDISGKIAEYDGIIEQNHGESLQERYNLNQAWYIKELAALGTYIKNKGIAESDAEILYGKLLEARKAKNAKADLEELEAIKGKVKAWDKAYENIQVTLTNFFETGKLDMDSFKNAFKNMVANLVSSWMVNMARMSLPVWMGGYASNPATALAGGAGSGSSSGGGSGSSSGLASMTFGEFLTGGWATKLGSYFSENGESSIGTWLTNAGTDGIFSGAGGAGVTTAVATALVQGTMTGDWKKSFVSGIGTGLGAAIGSAILPGIGTVVGAAIGGAVANTASDTAIQYATYGSVLPGLGTSIGYVAGTIVGDKKDDANLFMAFGDPDKTVNQYDKFYGDPNKALYSPTGSGDWAYDPKKEWSVAESDVFAIDLRKGTYGIPGDQIIKIENTISDYFKNIFKTIDKTLGTSVKDFIRSSGIGLSINIENFQKYMKEGNIDAVIKNMTGQFFDAYGSALATSILSADASGLFTSEALTSLQTSGETLGDTFARVAGLLQKVPEGVRRIREIMAEGLTEAEAFQKLEGQYTFVSGILGNALSEAMKKGVEVADFETFRNTFTTSLENQLKAAVAASFQSQILTKIITDSFGSMADFSETMEKLRNGEITVEEFKSYLRSGVEAARASLTESEPLMKEFWDIINLTPSKADAALEQAKTYASNVVSGTITSALQMGVDAADWNVFKNNIQSQLNAQLQTIVLNSISSSMINSVISSVLPDGGDLKKLNEDFTTGAITAEEYSNKIQTLGTKITEAVGVWEPVWNSWMTLFNVKPKETKTDPVSEMAEKPDAVNTAIKQFKDNSADADLMLSFMDALVSKIPLMADDYAVLDAAIIKHREGLAEFGSGLSELTTSITGYVAEIKEQVNGLASAAGEAAQKAADAAKAASEAAKSAADSAKSAGEQKTVMLGVLRSTSKTADALDRLSPDGDALQVRTAS